MDSKQESFNTLATDATTPELNQQEDAQDTNVKKEPSTVCLLGTAFATFFSFSILQLIFANIANSRAMKGDSVAMMVDALTYLFNMIAEIRKQRYERKTSPNPDSEEETRVFERTKRKIVLQMEVFPPMLSVTVLLVVLIIILQGAIKTLINGTDGIDDDAADSELMLIFASLNLVLDAANVFCFSRARALLGFGKKDDENDDETQKSVRSQRSKEIVDLESGDNDGVVVEVKKGRKLNMNMLSAFTHVCADTMRSLAVIIAAAVAEGTNANPDIADSSASLVVSVLILMSLVPLFKGLYASSKELRSICKEEKAERQ